MSNDTIRPLLADLPRLSIVHKPPGTVAISHSAVAARVEESGHDIEDVTAWIRKHGGRLVKPPPVQSQTLRAGRRLARTVPADPYYVLPVAVLEE
jgi:hypothetical protein